MDGIGWNLALVLVFVLIGGLFAAAEIALVALREGQVHRLAERGRRGARVASLRADSNRFLSAVQIGVTFAGFFASSYGGATIAVRLEPALTGWGLPVGIAATLALIVVTALVSYLSLVLGELVPKRLALQRSEGVALLTAGVLDRLATVTRPLIWLLSKSTDGVVRLLGFDPQASESKVGVRDLLSFLLARDTMHQNQWIAAAAELREQGVEELPVPSNFPQSNEHREVSYQYLNFSDGQHASEGRWASGATPDGNGEFSYHDGSTTTAPMPPPTHPDARFYGTTELPNTMEKAAGTAQDKLRRE